MNQQRDYYNEELLQQNYNRIWDSNKEILLKGGKGDSFLQSSEKDTRMAIALLIRIKGEVSHKISEYIQKLKGIDSSLYYYPQQDFHITVLDILRGEPDRKIPENIESYVSCIQKCVEKISPFFIKFKGTTASDNCVLVCGYYEYGMEEVRQTIREALAENKLDLEERYKTFSSHITVARIIDKIRNVDAVLPNLKNDIEFGCMKVDSLELSFHNWYDSQKTKIAEFKLGK